MKVNCPKCDEGFEINESLADRKGRCPSCGHVFSLRRGAQEGGDGEGCEGSGSGAGMVWALLLAVVFAVIPFAFIYLWPRVPEGGEAPQLVNFMGRFHVVALHLPIGVLVLAGLMEFLGGRKRTGCCGTLSAGITVSLWVGALGAVVAVALGYLLIYGDSGYGGETLEYHKWFGVGIAGGAIAALFFRTLYDAGGSVTAHWVSRLLLLGTLLALGPGAHFGGNMTHGETFLTEHMPEPMKAAAAKLGWEIKGGKPKVSSLDEALVFPHVVLPILHEKCNSCHDEGKTKGKLRMDSFALLMAGGDTGDAVVAGDLEGSLMIERITIPEDVDPHDERMPPAGKPQLTEEEMAVLKWWVAVGAPNDVRLAEVEKPSDLKGVIEAAVDLAPQKARPVEEEEPEETVGSEVVEQVEPKVTAPEEPTVTGPVEPEPEVTEPVEPEEPTVTGPEVTEPEVTEPVEPVEPEVTEPFEPVESEEPEESGSEAVGRGD